MLVLDDIRYAHPGQAGGYQFSMQAQAGEVTAVSGASGSGKSTLLDLIAGFLLPASGAMTLDGTDMLPLNPENRPVSILFQSDLLFEHLTAGENIAMGFEGNNRLETQRRIDDALAEVGLAGFADQRASRLSGGEKQRVALARTLLRDRPVLLLDEPFSALDDETRISVRDLVARLTTQRLWHTILVSHHVDDVAALTTQRYRLEDRELRLG